MLTLFDLIGGGLAVSIGAGMQLFGLSAERNRFALAARIGLIALALAGLLEAIALLIALALYVVGVVSGQQDLVLIPVALVLLLGPPLRLIGLLVLLVGFTSLLRVPGDDEVDLDPHDAGPPEPVPT